MLNLGLFMSKANVLKTKGTALAKPTFKNKALAKYASGKHSAKASVDSFSSKASNISQKSSSSFKKAWGGNSFSDNRLTQMLAGERSVKKFFA